MLRPSLALLAACLLGCSTEEPVFTTDLAVAQCRTMEKCALGLFEENFSSMDACVDGVGHDLDRWVEDRFEPCVYDPQEASRCIRRVRTMSCEDWIRGDDERACDTVYDCAA